MNENTDTCTTIWPKSSMSDALLIRQVHIYEQVTIYRMHPIDYSNQSEAYDIS